MGRLDTLSLLAVSSSHSWSWGLILALGTCSALFSWLLRRFWRSSWRNVFYWLRPVAMQIIRALFRGGSFRVLCSCLFLIGGARAYGYGETITEPISSHKTVGTCATTLSSDSFNIRITFVPGKNLIPGTYSVQQYLNGSIVTGTSSFTVASNGTVSPLTQLFGTSFNSAHIGGTVQLKVTAAPAGSGIAVGTTVDGPVVITAGPPICDGAGAGTNYTLARQWIVGTTTKLLSAHGEIHANCHESHTLALFLNGSSVASATVAADNNSTSFIDFTDTTDRTGQSYAWKMDGATVSSGTITYDCQEYGCSASLSFSGTATCSATPTPTPSPTPSTTPYYSPSPTPGPSSTPGPPPRNDGVLPPNVGVNGGGVASDVIVDNPDDFYAPVKKAVEDASSGQTHADFPAVPAAEADLSDDGGLEDLKNTIDDAGQNMEDTVTDLSTRFDDFKASWNTLPTSLGSVSSLHIGLGGIFPGAPNDLDLTDWLGVIAVWRAICFWLLTIGFAILTIRAFSYQN